MSWYKLDNTTTGVQDSAGSNNGTNNGANEYAGFVNSLAGESSGMDSANLVVSDLQQTSGYSPYALDFDGINDSLEDARLLSKLLNFWFEGESAKVNLIPFNPFPESRYKTSKNTTIDKFQDILHQSGVRTTAILGCHPYPPPFN